MTRDFGFYEYAGVIIPGSVLGAGILWLMPEGRVLLSLDGLTFGALGLFVILSYAAGHIVQGVGNAIEVVWWGIWGGRPTEKVLAGKLLSPMQHKRLMNALAREPSDFSRWSTSERLAIVREVHSVVAAAGRADRVATFLGNYGLLRGLAASFLVLAFAAAILGKDTAVAATFGILFLVSAQRMHRFSKYYALELFVEYILVSDSSKGDTSAEGSVSQVDRRK